MYRWSSCQVYYGGTYYLSDLSKTNFILGLFDNSAKNSTDIFRAFMEESDDVHCLEYIERNRITDEEAQLLLKRIVGEQSLVSHKEMPKKERNEVLRKMKGVGGITVRQISRLTGIGSTTVHNA